MSNYRITVRGKHKKWCFPVDVDKKYIQEYIDDGLVINETFNTCPVWIVELRLVRPYCFLQDIINFRNPFK